MFALSCDYCSIEAWPINSVRLALEYMTHLICGPLQPARTKSSAKTLKHECILDKPGLCVAFPLGKPARHDEETDDQYNNVLTYLGYISTKGNAQLDVSQAVSRATRAPRGFRV